jgi:hypothetical protein
VFCCHDVVFGALRVLNRDIATEVHIPARPGYVTGDLLNCEPDFDRAIVGIVKSAAFDTVLGIREREPPEGVHVARNQTTGPQCDCGTGIGGDQAHGRALNH